MLCLCTDPTLPPFSLSLCLSLVPDSCVTSIQLDSVAMGSSRQTRTVSIDRSIGRSVGRSMNQKRVFPAACRSFRRTGTVSSIEHLSNDSLFCLQPYQSRCRHRYWCRFNCNAQLQSQQPSSYLQLVLVLRLFRVVRLYLGAAVSRKGAGCAPMMMMLVVVVM